MAGGANREVGLEPAVEHWSKILKRLYKENDAVIAPKSLKENDAVIAQTPLRKMTQCSRFRYAREEELEAHAARLM